MSPSINRVLIVGHLGKDPEIKYTKSDKPVCNFSVATSEKYNNQVHVEWHQICIWGPQAEACQKYLTKGSMCMVEGKLETMKWNDKNGLQRQRTQIVANRVHFLGSPKAKVDSPTVKDAKEVFGINDDVPPMPDPENWEIGQ
jgi:single-strand DNA-binding protein